MPVIRTAAVLAIKLAALFFLYKLLAIDLIFINLAVTHLSFVRTPFIHVAASLLIVSVIASIISKSTTPLIWTASVLVYTATFFVASRYATTLITLLTAVAAVNFIYRNRYTEPVLIVLPIVAAAWIFLTLIYLPYLVGWTAYVTQHQDLTGSISAGFAAIKVEFITALIITPVLVMYYLGKHHHRELYSPLMTLRSALGLQNASPRN